MLSLVNGITSLSILINDTVLLLMPYFSRGALRRAAGSQQGVDFWVTKGSIYLNIIGIFCVGLAPWGFLYIASLGLYSLGAGLADSLRSFATSAMDDEETVRRLYMGISMVEAIAGMAVTSIWSYVFSAGIRKGGAAEFFGAFGHVSQLQGYQRRHLQVHMGWDSIWRPQVQERLQALIQGNLSLTLSDVNLIPYLCGFES
ncbi:hypothetical protein C8A00DRAFT_37632 [Chaetomidium leptoderma]|uniref:Uncharacterized protein n=1 Tax=Chaetomidium leptoderma TaxID=669021 RepID=A0AAN6VFW4_9PEZI|nr:hypothetical protein C8A00DRAFT_37632 [Chaetomidium leptoderma]